MKFFEKKIVVNASDVLKSSTFLECDRKLLVKILWLVADECCAEELVDACIEWSKSECTRLGSEINAINLRGQLYELFDQIPFDQLTLEQLSQFISKYSGFFNVNELETIIQRLTTNALHTFEPISSKKQNKFEHEFICDRIGDENLNEFKNLNQLQTICETKFFANRKLLLTDIYLELKRSSNCSNDIKARITYPVVKGFTKLHDVQFAIPFGIHEFRFNLPEPMPIDTNINYSICVTFIRNCCENCYLHTARKHMALFGDNIEVRFGGRYDAYDIISKLTFQIPDQVGEND